MTKPRSLTRTTTLPAVVLAGLLAGAVCVPLRANALDVTGAATDPAAAAADVLGPTPGTLAEPGEVDHGPAAGTLQQVGKAVPLPDPSVPPVSSPPPHVSVSVPVRVGSAPEPGATP
ncbi:MAG TPA: hypothetical protein VM324_15010, partial [Egibacteraceae bacterium]|nr:hypothetical protein [Egibacteraceae bacterium]